MLAACAADPPPPEPPLPVLPVATPVAGGAATPVLTDLKWLDPAADRVALLTAVPAEPVGVPPGSDPAFELGRLAFRSPGLLGGIAAREGLRCQTCHVNGRNNPAFFLDGLSDAPGTVDTTTAVFSRVLGDGVFNHIAIPDLAGVAQTAPYGHDGREPSLAAFVRTVIVDEFDGDPPSARVFDGLLRYLEALDPAPPPAAPAPVTVAADFGDVVRGLDLLSLLMDDGDDHSATFVVFALRAELGRIAERFDNPDGHAARIVLVGLSDRVRAIRDALDAGDRAAARAALDAVRREAPRVAATLTAAEPRSYYNPDVLAEALAP